MLCSVKGSMTKLVCAHFSGESAALLLSEKSLNIGVENLEIWLGLMCCFGVPDVIDPMVVRMIKMDISRWCDGE